MRPPLYQRFVDKANAAITSAVEVYNKPAFAYREETFAILALNAWELLLKAQVLKAANNATSSLHVYERRRLKSGEWSKREYVKTNRAGNALSISLQTCIGRMDAGANRLPLEVRRNLEALTSIRDNSIHYITPSAKLARQAQEISAASVANYVLLAKRWFNVDLSKALNLVMPVSFVPSDSKVQGLHVGQDEARLIRHLQTLARRIQDAVDSDPDFSVAVHFQVSLEKSNLAGATRVQITNDPTAVKVAVSEHDIRAQYPWDFAELCRRLRGRYTNFSQDARFYARKSQLADDDRYAKVRYLDPGNPKSPKKLFYNPNIVPQFDSLYTKKAG